jgi:multidrug resistance efflux pump
MKSYSIEKYIIALLMLFVAACSSPKIEETTAKGNANLVKLSAEERQSLGLTVGELQQEKLSADLKINGQTAIQNQDKALITSLMGGMVKTIYKHLGDEVQAGEIIALVSHPDFINWQEEYLSLRSQNGGADTMAALFNPQYISLREEYLSLPSKIELAQLELRRQQELNAGQAGSLKQLQQIEADLKLLMTRQTSLQSQLNIISKHSQQNINIKRAALEEKLRLLGIAPEKLSYGNMQSSLALRSPIAGRVSSLTASIGTEVGLNMPVAEVVSSAKMSLQLEVYENQIQFFSVDKLLTFILLSSPQNQYEAKVQHIGTSFDPLKKTVAVQALILGEKKNILEGMSITATVSSSEMLYWAVPKEAIASEDGKTYIFVLRSHEGEEWLFERILVEKILAAGASVAIQLPKELAPEGLKIATNKAFFVLGKMTNQGEE